MKNELDTIKINQTELKYYTFKYNETQDCLCLGNGELFNHNDTPNIGYRIVDFNNRKVMEFFTLKRIKSGQQFFIDYNADSQVNVLDYKYSWQLSLDDK